MTMHSLDQDIKNLIENIYCCKFSNNLTVKKEDGIYFLEIFLSGLPFGGLMISKECSSDQEFLDYIEKELKKRRLDRSKFYKLIIYGNNECEEGI